MRSHTTLYGALAAALGLLPQMSADASDWGGSYAVGDSCHCTGALSSSLMSQMTPTPIGGQTIAQICERIGPGPGLTLIDGRFDHTVYPDAQCGNGPFAEGTELLDAECAGTREPAGSDCRGVGPRWDLDTAYADSPEAEKSAPPVIAGALPNEEDRAPHAQSVDDSPVESASIVEIGGQRWRQAPAGTPVSGGAAGSRIILDGDIWLKADDPVFLAQRELEEHRASVARAEAATTPKRSRPVEPVARRAAPAEPVDESPEALRDRQRELVAQARKRAADRRAAGLEEDAIAMTLVESDTPSAEPAVGAAGPDDAGETRSSTGSAPDVIVPVLTDEAITETAADDSMDDERAAELVAEQASEDAAQSVAPLSALRLPDDARSSSSDFGYLQAMPLSYEIGGAGVMLEGSAEVRNRYHLLARAGIADRYQELLLGVGTHYTPPNADRLTLLVTAGMEYGTFPLKSVESGLEVDDASTGFFLKAGSRLVLNPRFELEGGVGYSSFHEGDPHAFGGGYFHINDTVDLMSRFEVGDQDSYGIGIRVYY